LLAAVDDIRTLKRKQCNQKAIALFIRRMERVLKGERHLDHMVENITRLREVLDPKVDRKEAA
jgi:hypothetical protein